MDLLINALRECPAWALITASLHPLQVTAIQGETLVLKLLNGWVVSGVLTSHHAPFPVFPRACVSMWANSALNTAVRMLVCTHLEHRDTQEQKENNA